MVKKALNFFARDLSIENLTKIETCLEMVKFGISNTLLTFQDRFFEYGGDCDPDKRGLTIGGYESAWLADLVAAFILEKAKSNFKKTSYYGIYRDDGIVLFKGYWFNREIQKWLESFQKKVNRTC